MDDLPDNHADDAKVSLARRTTQLLVSQFVLGVGVALLLDARLGSDGFSMFVNGARMTLDVEFVIVNAALSVALIALAWARGRRPGVGTITHAVIVGVTVSLLLPVLPGPEDLALQWLEFAAAFVALSIGVAAYVAVDLGTGPLEAAAQSLDPPLRFGAAYSALQVSGALGGWAMGADFGAGTFIVVLFVGPVVERFVPLFRPRGRGGGA